MSFITVTANQDGQRIDNFLVKHFKNVPKSKIYKIIRKGEVRVNKGRIKPEYKLKLKDEIRIPPIRVEEKDQSKRVIPTRLINLINDSVLFENDDFFVVNKPNGIAVHSGTGLSFGVVDILKQARPEQTIELVHRLDRDTSGCLMIAKSRKALLILQDLLKENKISKTYVAAVHGQWKHKQTKIEFPLIKYLMDNGEKRVKVSQTGKSALTKVKSVQIGKKTSLLTLKLITGRMHQIRVHCAEMGHAILNDDKYGKRNLDKALPKTMGKKMMLHAKMLEIASNSLCQNIQIVAPEPDSFRF